MTAQQNSAVFWSYAHADDELDRGRVLLLSRHLRDEYQLLTGHDLDVFVDRDGIAWGDEWRTRVDAAIMSTAFFLPLVTPRYFQRPECRRELLTFHAQAESRHLRELVLPILYIPVRNLGSDNKDEAVALVSRTQYVDWTDLRLTAVDSVEYRRGVNGLALRLVELVEQVSAVELEREVMEAETAAGGADDHDHDLESLLEQAEPLWEDWLEAVQRDEVRDVQYLAVTGVYAHRIAQLKRIRASPKTLMLAYKQQARDMLPLLKEHVEWADTYSTKTIELTPVVTAILRSASESPSAAPLLEDVFGKVMEATERVAAAKRRRESQEGERVSLAEYVQGMPLATRGWQEVVELAERSDAKVEEANQTVSQWRAELQRLLGGPHELRPAVHDRQVADST